MSTVRQVAVPTGTTRLRISPSQGWWDINLRELWEYRELLYFFIWRDIKVRYKQTVIGIGWAVIQPFFTMLVFTLFFGRLARIPSDGMPYPVFYYTGLVLWMYFANAIANVTNTIVEHQRVVTKVYFPRLILPLSATLSGLVDVGVSFAVLIVLLLFYGVLPSAAILFTPVFVLLTVATVLGAGLWLSALNAIYRDVRYVVPFFIQFWMFVSPVAYASSLVPARWRWLYGLNPMAGIIEGFRWSLTGHGQAPGVLLLASMCAVFLLVLGGLGYFHKMESTIADVV